MIIPFTKVFKQRCLTLTPQNAPEAILIFLHGLTENPHSHSRIFTTKSLTFMPENSKICYFYKAFLKLYYKKVK